MRKDLGIVVVQKLAICIYKLNKFSGLCLFNSGLLGLHKIAELVNHFNTLAPIGRVQIH